MNTETEKPNETEARFFKNAVGEIIPVLKCNQCIWGVADLFGNWHCTQYEQNTTPDVAEAGFPDFCELPTQSQLILTQEPTSGWTLQKVCDLLNAALTLDHHAVDNLVTLHVLANKKLAEHPTVQVRQILGERYTVSFLGLLNGLSDGSKYLVAEYHNTTGKLERFRVYSQEDLEKIDPLEGAIEKMDSK